MRLALIPERALLRSRSFEDAWMMVLPRGRSVGRSLAASLLVLSILLIGAACETESLKPSGTQQPSELVWTLDLDKRAALLSSSSPLYDTLTVIATPHNYRGEVLSGLPAPQFISSNPGVVSVSSDGVVVGLQPGEAVVTATLVSSNLRAVDSVLLRVVGDPAPPMLGQMSIHPVSPDSAKIGGCNLSPCDDIYSGKYLDSLIRLTNADGTPFPYQAPVDMRVADTTIAAIVPNAFFGPILSGRAMGHVDVYATTTVFGETKADTVRFRVGWPVQAAIHIQPTSIGSHANYFVEPAVKLGVGGIVGFLNVSTVDPTDIVFDDTTTIASAASAPPSLRVAHVFCAWHIVDCDGSGNVVLAAPSGGAFRRFTAPGVYDFHSPMHGISGRVIVIDESTEGP